MNSNQSKNLWNDIIPILVNKKMTIATMESCTGGGIANKITSVSGASEVIKESYITYCNEAKIKQGVDEDIITKYTVYSKETAIEMARAVKKQAKSSIGIGVTGMLGRIDPYNPIEKLNHVWYSIIDVNDKCITREIIVENEIRENQKEFVIEQIAKNLFDIIK